MKQVSKNYTTKVGSKRCITLTNFNSKNRLLILSYIPPWSEDANVIFISAQTKLNPIHFKARNEFDLHYRYLMDTHQLSNDL